MVQNPGGFIALCRRGGCGFQTGELNIQSLKGNSAAAKSQGSVRENAEALVTE